MAPVQLDPEIRYELVARLPLHVATAAWLTFEVGRSIYRSYKSLGPPQDTRDQIARRSRLIPVFTVFALASLAVATYASSQHAILSYKVWASQRDVKLPTRFYGDQGILPSGENATDVYLTQWLSETTFHVDAFEILAEKARRFWWAQQIDLSLLSWTMLLAIEGRRRNIPLLWCYQLLGQLVSLSFAQNLFFLTLLLTPTPLPRENPSALPVSRYIRIRDSIFPPKPANWAPHSALYGILFVPILAAVALSTVMVNTPSMVAVTLAIRGLTFVVLVLPHLVPEKWGHVSSHPHEAYGTYHKLFAALSLGSLLLHSKATVVGLAYNTPDPYYHRHSIFLPFDVEKRSEWERTTTAFGRLLDATSDHPVVWGIGWDVLLTTLSVGIWAAVRAADVSNILACAVPFYPSQSIPGPSKSKASASQSGSVSRRKKKTASDAAYEPTPSEAAEIVEGDELPEPDQMGWETTALVWGLTAVGGLGVGSAGVYGSECVAR